MSRDYTNVIKDSKSSDSEYANIATAHKPNRDVKMNANPPAYHATS